MRTAIMTDTNGGINKDIAKSCLQESYSNVQNPCSFTKLLKILSCE